MNDVTTSLPVALPWQRTNVPDRLRGLEGDRMGGDAAGARRPTPAPAALAGAVDRAGRAANAAFDGLLRMPPVWLVVSTVAVLALVGVASHLAGGSRSAVPHLYYVPVILAAIRLGPRGGVLTALASGVLAGPLLLEDVESGLAQDPAAWLTRSAAFVVVALLVSWFTGHAAREVNRQVEDVRSATVLRGALARGEMVVHYQPVLAMEGRDVVGFEALARWERPGQGVVPAGDFIPAAERSGVIAELDRHVLREALRQVAAWQPLGDFTVAVNVSATRFAQPGLVEEIRAAVQDAGLAMRQLRLEVTETAIIRDVAAAAAQITALREMGVRVAIDDFGTGHSSLSYLHRFDVDIVKIPRSFVSNVSRDAKRSALVAGMIQFLQVLGTDIVAEGISSLEEYEHLHALGCPYGQGFFLGVPASAAELEPLLRAGAGRGASPTSLPRAAS